MIGSPIAPVPRERPPASGDRKSDHTSHKTTLKDRIPLDDLVLHAQVPEYS